MYCPYGDDEQGTFLGISNVSILYKCEYINVKRNYKKYYFLYIYIVIYIVFRI